MNTQINHPIDQSAVTNSNVALFDSQYLRAISEFASVMANGVATVPQHLQGNPADCMAVAMQAAQWQMNPFAVAQKTHLINGVLGYEAQLVNAVITRSGVLTTRFEYDWFGPWKKILGKFAIKKNDKGKEYRVPDWSMADEEGIGVRIFATLRGESEPRELELFLAQARVRNSTLWAEDPRQQMAYLAVKRWARLYCPDVILGVYTPDELEERQEKIINSDPAPRLSLSDLPKANAGQQEDISDTTVSENEEATSAADTFRLRIGDAETIEQTTVIRSEIEEHKTALGTDYTELKNKAVARYHQINAASELTNAINALPAAGTSEAKMAFEAVQKKLNAAVRRLGAELHERFAVTLDDLRPEYQ